MTVKFVLLVNKQGQTRMAKYFTEHLTTDERRALEGEVVRRSLSRTDKQVRTRQPSTLPTRGTSALRERTT